MPSNKVLLAAGGAVLAVALAIGIVVIAGGGDSEPVAQLSPSPSPSPTPDPTCPLTGEDPPRGLDLSRPAVAVKIEDSPAARPQSGLESADLVYEEIVEGGITRFMAIYHCHDAEQAGPVRSARFDDPKIARPFTSVLAFSGGNSIVEAELARRHMVVLDEDSADGGLFRVPPGVFETHNLYAHTKKLRGLAGKAKPPQAGVFTFGDLAGKTSKARSVTLRFTAANAIEYKWEGGTWRRYEAGQPFFTSTGDQIAVPNVLIQEVEVNPSAHIRDVAGNASPELTLVGTGRAFLFRDGRVIKGTWSIKKEFAAPKFTTRKGDPFVFAPGPIWVELLPSKTGAVKGSIEFK